MSPVDLRADADGTDGSKRQLRMIVDVIPMQIWFGGPDGTTEFLNRRWLEYTGVSADEALGWKWIDTVHPDDRPALLEHRQNLLRLGEPGEIEARLRRVDGEYRWFLLCSHPLRDAAGSVTWWCGANTDIDDRKRAETEAQARPLNVRAAIDSLPGFVCTNTPAGAVEQVNLTLLRYTGKPLEQLRNWSSVVHPDDLPQVAARWTHSVATGDPFDTDVRVRNGEGLYRWFHCRGLPSYDTDGGILRWYNLLTDIDDRKRVEDALRASEHDLRSIIDTTPGLIVILTDEGVVEQVNRQVLDYFGRTVEELQRWGTTDAVHPDDLSRTIAAWTDAVATGQPFDGEHRLRRADGAYRWFQARSLPLRDSGGRIVRWFMLITDIDDRKRAEDALRAREHDLRSILDTMPGYVATMGAAGGIELVNRPILDYTGRSLEELQDWVNSDTVHPDDLPRVTAAWLQAIATGQLLEYEHRLRRADGAYRWFHLRGLPLRDEAGVILRWHVLLNDIDDRRHAEEALRQTQVRLSRAAQIATVGELAASIAHEVNQPLAAVVTNAHACLRWLSAVPPNLEKAFEAADRIVRDGKDAGEVVQRVRSLFKHAAVERVVVDMNEVIAQILKLLDAERAKKNVSVSIDLESDLPPVSGDRVQLQQLVLNLLLNGLEAMESVVDRPRRLAIRSTRQNDLVRIEIRDCGVGLKDPVKAFEPFFTTKLAGLGMGLAICRSIVESHGGQLWAVSDGADGSTFCFTLPWQPRIALEP